MGKFTLGTMIVVGVTTGFTAAFGAGSAAAADALIGKAYADAVSEIGSWGGSPVVSLVVGARAERDACIVTNWRKDTHDNSKVLLSLNCNGAVAAAGMPGSSAASPEGRAALKANADIQWRSENPEWCADAAEKHPEWGTMEGCSYGD